MPWRSHATHTQVNHILYPGNATLFWLKLFARLPSSTGTGQGERLAQVQLELKL